MYLFRVALNISAWLVPEFPGSGSEVESKFRFRFQSVQQKLLLSVPVLVGSVLRF